MKKLLFAVGLSVSVMAACNSGDSNSSTQDTTPVLSQTNNENRSTTDTLGIEAATVGSATGKDLIVKNDCLTCHKEHDKLIGPAYADVAKKYEATTANIDMLVAKIITGGKGNWGEIPMTPHSTVSKADAAEMVKYILSIN